MGPAAVDHRSMNRRRRHRRRAATVPQAAYYEPAGAAAAAALTFELAMPTWPELSPDSSIIVVSI